MAYWDWPADPNPGVTRMLVTEMLQEASEGHARYWTLRLRSDFTFVGLCDLSELHPEKSADLGFMLMRRYWGQGLAQEAVTAVLAFAQQLGLRSVHAACTRITNGPCGSWSGPGLWLRSPFPISRSDLECFVTVAATRFCERRIAEPGAAQTSGSAKASCVDAIVSAARG